MNPLRLTVHNWRIPLWGLMALPLACAPIFLWFAIANRVPPVPRWERENRWTLHPLGEFFPSQGEAVRSPYDDLVKVSRVMAPFRGEYFGRSRWVTPNGMINTQWHTDADAGGDEFPASAEFLAQLPALLKNLPKSEPLIKPESRLYVAFPIQGVWEVRIYNKADLPKEVIDLVEPLFASGL